MTSLADDTGRPAGLTEEDAATRLKAEGPNELPTAKPRHLLATVWEIVREPMVLLLLGAGSIYFVLGDLTDALVLLASILVLLGISLYQVRKTERALDALRDLSSPRALVIRGGQQRRIAGREVVRGDVVMLSEGDRVPADGVVLSSGNLSIDESLLTGESVAVRKAPSGWSLPHGPTWRQRSCVCVLRNDGGPRTRDRRNQNDREQHRVRKDWQSAGKAHARADEIASPSKSHSGNARNTWALPVCSDRGSLRPHSRRLGRWLSCRNHLGHGASPLRSSRLY